MGNHRQKKRQVLQQPLVVALVAQQVQAPVVAYKLVLAQEEACTLAQVEVCTPALEQAVPLLVLAYDEPNELQPCACASLVSLFSSPPVIC